MSTDDLIASLCAGGRVDSQGGFSLDRERAREKLRTFQVAEPHRYVLHLVALAALRGATAIAFEIDTDDLWARFDGAPLGEHDFEDLYSSSFAAAITADDRARQQLAVGLNAALALNPRRARVTSGPPGARVRLEVSHAAEDVIARAPDDDGEGTVVHVKQRFRAGLVVRFWRHVRGDMLEEAVLRERAAYAAIAVTVNGARIGGGAPLAGEVQFRREVSDADGRWCAAGLRDDPGAPAEVRLVRHGVWVSTLRPTHLPGGVLAVVRDDRLQTDLSGQEVVHDGARERCLALVDRAVEAATVDYLLSRGTGVDAWLRQRLRPAWREWSRMRVPATPLGAAAAALPWWSDIFGRPVTLTELRTCLERQAAVFYTTTEFAGRLEASADTVVAAPPTEAGEPSEDLLLLRELFGTRLRDRTRELEREVRRAAARRLWRARPSAAALDPQRYAALAPLRVEAPARAIEGQVGLRPEAGGPSTVRVIVDGHLLCELSVELPLPVDAAIAGLSADEEFVAPPRDDRFALGLLAALDGALWMIEYDLSQRTAHDLDGEARALARRWLGLRFDPEGPRRWLQAFGFRAAEIDQALAQRAAAALPRICRARAGVPLARLLEPWLAECERLPTACGRSLSLGAVALALSRGERVMWTDEDEAALPGLDRILLALDASAQAVVDSVFGDAVAKIEAAELRALLAEQRFMVQPEEAPALAHGSCGAQVRVEEGPMRAVLGVRFFRDGEPLRAPVRVLVRGRKLASRTIWAPFAGVVAVVRDDRLTPTAGWTGVVTDSTWRAVERALLAALPRLVAEALQRTPAGLIGDVLAASFPSAAMRRAWERLVEVEGATAGEASYELLLGLTAQVPLERLDRALEQALRLPARLAGERRVHALGNIARLAEEVGGRVDPARARATAELLREIRSACGQHRPGAPLAEQVASGHPALLHEFTLPRADGAVVSLADLLATRARGEKIATSRVVVSDAADPRARALLVGDAEEALLLRLLGTGATRRVYGAEKVAALRASALPPAPADALARAFVRASDVVGELWLPAGAEDEDCRVGLHAEDGALIKRVSLLPPLPLAGALTGAGARPDGFRVELSLAALSAVRDAALRLYDELLKRGDPAATLALRRVDGRIGEARLAPPLQAMRERLRAAARAIEVEPGPSSADVRDVLADMFSELEASAREQARPAVAALEGEHEPALATPPPPPPTPEVRLLVAIRLELRALREQHERLLSNFNLDHLRTAELGPRAEPITIGPEAIVLNRSHPLIQRAAAECERDPWWVDVLASLVFTAFNVWREEITDADEQAFHRSHLERVLRRAAAPRG